MYNGTIDQQNLNPKPQNLNPKIKRTITIFVLNSIIVFNVYHLPLISEIWTPALQYLLSIRHFYNESHEHTKVIKPDAENDVRKVSV